MRLTKKVNKGMNGTPIYVGSYGNIVNVGDNQATSMVHCELGHLEDIEEKHNIKSVDDLDSRLTALEIIKKKNVKIDVLKYESDVVFYNMTVFEKEEKLTQEEFILLKKVLSDEILLCIH